MSLHSGHLVFPFTYMAAPLHIARGDVECFLLPALANRHGLITGATGTGKTVSLQVLAEHFSSIGVPVFMADVKGDLAGMSQPGKPSPKLDERLAKLKITDHAFAAYPVVLWDVYGEQGHPLRATISEMGPLLMSRILDLNETQTGVLTAVFKIADDRGLLLLDMQDLRAMLAYVGGNASEYTVRYGNISPASVGAIQRGLLTLETQGGDKFFGEPALNLDDLIQTVGGKGVINILAADRLLSNPRIYATFLLWLLSELFETLPEVGDPEKPKLVFFFDEAHLLFNEAPSHLKERIEQVVRLIRSKGVGVYFVTQNPLDVPSVVLGQLGNRIQHALRAYTPRDQEAVRVAASTFRPNPKIDTEAVISELAVGEALVSFMDDKGRPNPVERAFILPPQSRIGPISPEERKAVMASSIVAGVYDTTLSRESAYEKLNGKADSKMTSAGAEPAEEKSWLGKIGDVLGGDDAPAGSKTKARTRETPVEAAAKSVARAMGSEIGRRVIRGVLGSLFGGRR